MIVRVREINDTDQWRIDEQTPGPGDEWFSWPGLFESFAQAMAEVHKVHRLHLMQWTRTPVGWEAHIEEK